MGKLEICVDNDVMIVGSMRGQVLRIMVEKKKVKIKKPFSNFAKFHFLLLKIYLFLGSILSLRQVCFFEISIKFLIL
jgi:hypothetical protein